MSNLKCKSNKYALMEKLFLKTTNSRKDLQS